jgi:diacylglycerol kinase family enzyme
MGRRDFARTMLRLRRGEHVGEEGVHYVRVPDLRIQGTKPISVNVDGEVSGATRLDYRARPKDLWVHLAHRPGEAAAAEPAKKKRPAKHSRAVSKS